MDKADEQALVNRVAIKIPPFWADEPELWFAQLEGQFALVGITQDATKYAYVLANIETRHAKEVKDLITSPPADNKYEALKKAFIQRLSASQEQQIRQLLEHEEMGDRRPSQFLRHLQSLARTAIPEQLLRTLWMGRLPSQLQAILASRTMDNLEEVAEQADKIHEVTCRAVAVASVQPASSTTTLEQQVVQLAKQVASLNSRLSRELDKSKKRERSRSHSKKKPEDKSICYYHRRFQEKAQKCTQPCTFKKAEN